MTPLPDHIKTPESVSEFRTKEKGSTFISLTKGIETEEEANSYLQSVKKKYYDATHHCYSYKLVNGLYKYSDAGEPNGTAGIRIYNAQNHYELTNLITIIVRYFGGVKLGVGPLGKAYYEAASENLATTKILKKLLHHEMIISYGYEESKTVHRFITKHSIIIRETLFNEVPKMICLVPSTQKSKLLSDISTLITRIQVIETKNSEYIVRND